MISSEIPVLAITGFFTIGLGFFILISGYLQAKQRKFINHKKIMILSVIVLAAFLVQYVTRSVFLNQETHFDGPEIIKNYI